MTKPEFKSRFFKAINFSREFCGRLLGEEMPERILIDFGVRRSEPNHDGKWKVWGGRLLGRSQLESVEPEVAWRYLWVEGKVPVWINVMYGSDDGSALHLEIDTGHHLWEDGERLMHAREGNPPFHILGPSEYVIQERRRTGE